MKSVTNIFIAVLISLPGFAQTINASKSLVSFEIGNLGFNTVDGTFKKMTGEVKFSPSNLSSSSFDICIDASTVDTDSRKRDEHLKKEGFLDVEKHPKICFKSEIITKQDGKYITKGKLTMHGVTKQVEIPFSYSNNTFRGSLTVNRYDYEIGMKTSKFMVSENAEITIVCVVNKND